jgi:hypothetical protein
MFSKLKLQSLVLTALLFAGSVANAGGLPVAYSIEVIGVFYKIEKPDGEPNLYNNTPVTFKHKLYTVDANPNTMRAQRRIVQGWTTDADTRTYCLNRNGERTTDCSFRDWSLSWQLDYEEPNSDFKIYSSSIDLPGSAYKHWPRFPADEGAYHDNPHYIYYAPKTTYYIETRFEHPTAGWLYADTPITLYCNDDYAWNHYTGLTSCPGL